MNLFTAVLGASGTTPQDGSRRGDTGVDQVDGENATAFAAALGQSLTRVDAESGRLPRPGPSLQNATDPTGDAPADSPGEVPVRDGGATSQELSSESPREALRPDTGLFGSGSKESLRPAGSARPSGGEGTDREGSLVRVRGRVGAPSNVPVSVGPSGLAFERGPDAAQVGEAADPELPDHPNGEAVSDVRSRGPGPVEGDVHPTGTASNEGAPLAQDGAGGSTDQDEAGRLELERPSASISRPRGSQPSPSPPTAGPAVRSQGTGHSVPGPEEGSAGRSPTPISEGTGVRGSREGARPVRSTPVPASASTSASSATPFPSAASTDTPGSDGPEPSVPEAPLRGTGDVRGRPESPGEPSRVAAGEHSDAPEAGAASPPRTEASEIRVDGPDSPPVTDTSDANVARAKDPTGRSAPDSTWLPAGIPHGASPGDTIQVRTRGTNDPDKDLRRLDPRLRAAVGRVLQRLESEHGIEGDVVEGYRSASRQRSLYAQGRTEPGHVVTWTLDSAHMRGRAVDLVLNQQWDDLTPYRTLQEVAAEEGLKTLGMKDPGHLELPAPGAGRRAEFSTPVEYGARRTLARAASVAGVAGRATVARAASPAVPGVMVRPTSAPQAAPEVPAPTPETLPPTAPDPIPAAPDPIPTPVPVDVPRSEVAILNGDAPSAPRGVEAPEPRAPAVSPAISTEAGSRSGQGLDPVARGSSLEMNTRVEQVRQVQDAAELSRSGTSVDLGDVDGLGTRVRLNLRGGRIGARIEALDPKLGAALEEQGSVLKTALEARGLETDAIQIRTVLDDAGSLRSANRTIESVHVGDGVREGKDRPRDTPPEHKGSRQEPRPDDFRQRREREEGRDDR